MTRSIAASKCFISISVFKSRAAISAASLQTFDTSAPRIEIFSYLYSKIKFIYLKILVFLQLISLLVRFYLLKFLNVLNEL